MVYFQDSVITYSWDEINKIVIAEWKGFASFAKMQTVLEKGLELIQEKNCTKWLGDTSNLAPFSTESSSWIVNNWMPRATAAGLKSIAYVVPKSAITRISLGKGIPGSSIASAFFDNQAAAKAWLRTC